MVPSVGKRVTGGRQLNLLTPCDLLHPKQMGGMAKPWRHIALPERGHTIDGLGREQTEIRTHRPRKKLSPPAFDSSHITQTDGRRKEGRHGFHSQCSHLYEARFQCILGDKGSQLKWKEKNQRPLPPPLTLTVIVEGVENNEQLGFLREHRSNERQGFLFSKLIRTDAFEAMLCNGLHSKRWTGT